MANELIINYPTGSTLYSLLFDATGQIWNGSSFVAPSSTSWTDYDIAMTEVATTTGVYRASMPAAAAGVYSFVVRRQAGGSPAVTDIAVGVGRIEWTGTAEIMPASTTNITAGTINSVLGTVSANVVQIDGATTPVDNLVLALGTGGLVEKLNSMLEAAGLAYRFTVAALAEAPSGSGLTAQETANAVSNLAPVGTPATGSMGADLDAIRLITDNINVTDVTYVAESNAGHLTVTIGRTFDESVTALVIPVDWEEAYFTIKRSVEDDESEAIVQLLVSNPADVSVDGLRRLNAVVWHEAVTDDPETEIDETSPEPFDQDLGALTVNQAGGSVRIYLTDELTAQLSTAKRIGWDVKFIDSNGDSTGKRGIIDLVRTETQTV